MKDSIFYETPEAQQPVKHKQAKKKSKDVKTSEKHGIFSKAKAPTREHKQESTLPPENCGTYQTDPNFLRNNGLLIDPNKKGSHILNNLKSGLRKAFSGPRKRY